MGLVEYSPNDPDKFYITKFMQSFLLTNIGNFFNNQEDQEFQSQEKFIIVETNFRVFAYTNSKLYKEILKLFLEPKTEFANMLYGVLTKHSVERAYRQKISAK